MKAHNSTRTDAFTLENLKQLYRVIDLYWFLVAVGLFRIIKTLRKGEANHLVKSVLLATSLTFALTPIWPYFLDRILFLMAPFLIVIVMHGIGAFKQFGLPLIVAGGFLNIFISYIIYRSDSHGAILIGQIVYLGIIAAFTMYLNKERIFGKPSP